VVGSKLTHYRVIWLLALLVSASACESPRVDKLEKDMQALRAEVQALKEPKASLESQPSP